MLLYDSTELAFHDSSWAASQTRSENPTYHCRSRIQCRLLIHRFKWKGLSYMRTLCAESIETAPTHFPTLWYIEGMSTATRPQNHVTFAWKGGRLERKWLRYGVNVHTGHTRSVWRNLFPIIGFSVVKEPDTPPVTERSVQVNPFPQLNTHIPKNPLETGAGKL